MEFIQQLLHREAESHKYSYGHVLVIGGSRGMVGAPLLAARAALRSGAGLVSIAAAPAVADRLEGRVDEIMTLSFSDDQDTTLDIVSDFITNRKVQVIIIGPGMPPDHRTADMLQCILKRITIPVIVDGGALVGGKTIIAQLKSSLNQRVILTPHFGEFKTLTGHNFSSQQKTEIQNIAVDFAHVHGTVVVLKGSPSTVLDSNGNSYRNTTGNPGLAQGGDAFTSAKSGVYLHGLAGDIAAESKTQPAMIASDVIEYLPEAFKRCQ
jgi:hydroxyethylthiazole kinase-like uncharacterized protein yjeF